MALKVAADGRQDERSCLGRGILFLDDDELVEVDEIGR